MLAGLVSAVPCAATRPAAPKVSAQAQSVTARVARYRPWPVLLDINRSIFVGTFTRGWSARRPWQSGRSAAEHLRTIQPALESNAAAIAGMDAAREIARTARQQEQRELGYVFGAGVRRGSRARTRSAGLSPPPA